MPELTEEYACYPGTTIIREPGKFEGCDRYVPYFWERFLEGFTDFENGDVLGFYVSMTDKERFPELKRRRTVKLIEDDNGFVHEV